MHDLVSPCQLRHGVRRMPPGRMPLCNSIPPQGNVSHITHIFECIPRCIPQSRWTHR